MIRSLGERSEVLPVFRDPRPGGRAPREGGLTEIYKGI